MIFPTVSTKRLIAALITLSVSAVSTNAADIRYKDRLFSVEKAVDVPFAEDVPHLNSLHQLAPIASEATGYEVFLYNNEKDVKKKPLLMDIYTPKGDSEKNRALVIVSHGGAMVAGAKDDTYQQTVNYCDSLAARGFVAASIQYRRGVSITGKNLKYNIDSVDFARSVYRGVQDVSTAVRFMRKYSDQFGIDPNRIYLVGNSSGAILSLENIYAQSEADFPSYIKKSGAPDLGDLNMYGEQGIDPHANGVVALWGAIHNPNIIGDNKTPILLVHGTADETVLFKTGRPLSEGVSVDMLKLSINAPTLYGSFVIDSVLTAKNIEHETYFVDGAEHEFYDDYEYGSKVKNKVFDFLYKLASFETTTAIKTRTFAQAPKSAIQMEPGNLRFSLNRGNNLKYAIMDLRGRPIMTGKVSVGESVDLSQLSNGIYMLRVQGMQAIRFSITR